MSYMKLGLAALAGAAAYGASHRGHRAQLPGRKWKTVGGIPIYRTADGEYVVVPDPDYELGWYYTDDPQDAGGTAMIIAKRPGGALWKGRRAKYVGHHMVEDGAVYVDTAFLNRLKQVNLSLEHSGFGDFYLPDFGEGRVDFRRQYVDWPKEFVGRTHLVRDASGGKRIKQIIRQMEKAGASVEV